MNNSLFSITTDLKAILNAIEEQGGEITEEQEKSLEIAENDLENKFVGYREVIDNQESFISRIDDEIKRLQDLKKSRKSLIERLKSNLVTAIMTFGDVEIGTMTFTTRKSQAVEVEDVNALPDQYKKIKVTETADKTLIKKEIKSGVEIDGCRIVDNYSLRIK